MKLLIAGSRSITDFDIAPYIPRDTDLIICGGARGVDTLAEQYADKMKISKYIIRPNYTLYKKGAPIKRNYEMVHSYFSFGKICRLALGGMFPY